MRYWDGTIVRTGDYLLVKGECMRAFLHLGLPCSYVIHRIVSMVPKKRMIVTSEGKTFILDKRNFELYIFGYAEGKDYRIVSKGQSEEDMKKALIIEKLSDGTRK